MSRQILGADADGVPQNDVATYGADVDNTTNATVYSDAWSSYQQSEFAVQVEFAGGSSLTTAVSLWSSDKRNPNTSDDADWVERTEITFAGITAGAAAKETQNVSNAGSRWFRLKFVTSAGSGKAAAWRTSRANA